MENIFLIDDNQLYCEQVQKTLKLHGMRLEYETSGYLGQETVLKKIWGAVLLDVDLKQDINGLHVLKYIVEHKPHLPVIMISGASTLRTAVEATKMGAYDFLEKPVDVDRLLLTIRRALEKNKLLALNKELEKELSSQYFLVGKSRAFQKLINDADHIAPTNTKVFICGESGVGKDVIARYIHFRSKREANPFVHINCASIQPNLLEAELFGHVRGAYTSASDDKTGLIASAEGGTLFLDQVTELDLFAQAKLLKFIQDGEYSVLGSSQITKSDVRIISATNKDIQREVADGRFREDLYYRMNVYNLYIPPLRERLDDLVPLSEFFLRLACRAYNKNITGFSNDALELIQSQRWNGNVRQLKSAIERMVIFANVNVIDTGTAATAIQMDRTNETLLAAGTYDEAFSEFEKLYFLNRLNINNWNIANVAAEVNMTVDEFEQKLRHLGINYRH